MPSLIPRPKSQLWPMLRFRSGEAWGWGYPMPLSCRMQMACSTRSSPCASSTSTSTSLAREADVARSSLQPCYRFGWHLRTLTLYTNVFEHLASLAFILQYAGLILNLSTCAIWIEEKYSHGLSNAYLLKAAWHHDLGAASPLHVYCTCIPHFAVTWGGMYFPQLEEVKPQELAIDRPSPKFLNFLRKHYKLQSFVKQVMQVGHAVNPCV